MSFLPTLLTQGQTFGQSLANTYFANYVGPKSPTDVVGIFDKSMRQLFQMARPGKASVAPRAKVMDHTVESGSQISDHRVIQPKEIEIMIYVTDYVNTYQLVKQAFESNDLLTVVTRADTFSDMTIMEMPHEETPEMVDVFQMILKLREVKFFQTQFQALPPAQTKRPTDSSTVDRGQQTGKDKGGSVAFEGIFGKKS